MSCCQPQQLLLSLHKPQLDFNNTELYHQHITTLLQSHSKIYAFDKLNSLEIEHESSLQVPPRPQVPIPLRNMRCLTIAHYELCHEK